MKTHIGPAALRLAACTLAAACAPLCAQTLPFHAIYSGDTRVVEVIDETGPVLRFSTDAEGVGSFDLGRYFSTDVIDMSTGAGTGVNVFTAGNGDELHGRFSVQVIPTAVAQVVDLVGQATFIGGTGRFSGASGSALFSGTGVFTSATTAVSSLSYQGEIALVPEPGSGMLLAAGMAALALQGLRRRPRSVS